MSGLPCGAPNTLSQDEFNYLSPKLMAALRLSCTYEPEADFKQQVYSATATQKVAGERQPPNICQLRTEFGLVVKRQMQLGQTELPSCSREDKNYNRQRLVAIYKASNEDIAGLKVLCVCWETTIELLEGIWGRDKVDNTIWPLAVVAMTCIDRYASSDHFW